MWSFKNLVTSKHHFFSVGQEYSVGRKDSDILILDDMSISRKHAIIKVDHSAKDLSNVDKVSTLMLKDVSKLGTQLPAKRISNGDEEQLKAGDVISFGTLNNNKYQVVYEPLIVTSSCIPKPTKKLLKKVLFRLGGSLLDEWNSKCVYVVMQNLALTVKVACALVSQRHIVTPDFFDDLLKHATSCDNDIGHITHKLADHHYLPIMMESQIDASSVSFAPLPQRTTLFKDKTFVFLFSEQYNCLKSVVELASGTSHLVNVATNDFTLTSQMKDLLLSSCVVLPESNENSLYYHRNVELVINFLRRSHRCLIPESEFGLAILSCSTTLYCNPLKKSHPNYSQSSTSTLSILHTDSTHSLESSNLPTKAVMKGNVLPVATNATENKSSKAKSSKAKSPSKTRSPSKAKSPSKARSPSKAKSSSKTKVHAEEKTIVKTEVLKVADESSCDLFDMNSDVSVVESEQEERPDEGKFKRTRESDPQEARPSKALKTTHERPSAAKRTDTRPPSHPPSLQPLGKDKASSLGNITTQSNEKPTIHKHNYIKTQAIDTSMTDMNCEQRSKCAPTIAPLVVRGTQGVLVEWQGREVVNYKKFIKNEIVQAPFLVPSKDLFVQPLRDLKALKI